jgi:ATP-dependent DNA helicase DinG
MSRPVPPSGSPAGPGRGRSIPSRPPLTLHPDAAGFIRDEVARAGGREVCFLAEVGSDGVITAPRAVARGNRAAVLAAARDAPPGGIMLHNHPSGVLEPSDADLAVAARLHEEGLGTGIVDNGALELYVVVEPPVPRVRELLSPEELEALVAPGGALAALHSGFEDRGGQRTMIREVTRAYNEGGTLVAEAGTGTGKSLAYLLPAAAWALRNGERTVVSTATINLQEQLVGKDLPLVRRILGDDVRWALLKGRGNYISIRRAHLAAEQASSLFTDDRSREMTDLLAWVDRTGDGSLGDLPFTPSDEVWEEVRSDGDICLRARCPHFQACFYQRARREAASAELLVVNHHLLFSDIALRRATGNRSQAAVLPPYRHVVLDEAHNVEDAATDHLGAHLTRTGLFRTLARLDRNGKGILAAIQGAVAGAPDGDPHRGPLLQRLDARVHPALDDARARLELLFDLLEPRVPEGGEGTALRLGTPQGAGEPWDDPAVRERGEGLLGSLARLEREVAELRARIDLAEGWGERLEGRLLDLQSMERRVAQAAAGIRLVLDPAEGKGRFVRWLEGRRSPRRGAENLVLAAAPLEPGPLLRESLFEVVDTAVLASATLTVRGRFTFIRTRLGLAEPGSPPLRRPEVVADPSGWEPDPDPDAWPEPTFGVGEGDESPRQLDIRELVVPSPFDHARQSVLAVPTGLPDLRDPAFDRATAGIVAELASLTGGGLFVLFTAHRSLRRVTAHLREAGVEGRHPLFVHGEGDRARLLQGFVASGKGILLGTASFWEGVDVPGDPLRGLIIQKLPFRVPTEPITEARVEAIEGAGGDPFRDFMLPLAALRLKQGFGRLIRTRADRGAIVLLDDRVLSKRYGRVLLDSLPPTPVLKGPWGEVALRLREFYRNQQGIEDVGWPARGGTVRVRSGNDDGS